MKKNNNSANKLDQTTCLKAYYDKFLDNGTDPDVEDMFKLRKRLGVSSDIKISISETTIEGMDVDADGELHSFEVISAESFHLKKEQIDFLTIKEETGFLTLLVQYQLDDTPLNSIQLQLGLLGTAFFQLRYDMLRLRKAKSKGYHAEYSCAITAFFDTLDSSVRRKGPFKKGKTDITSYESENEAVDVEVVCTKKEKEISIIYSINNIEQFTIKLDAN